VKPVTTGFLSQIQADPTTRGIKVVSLRSTRKRWAVVAALSLTVALTAAACGGGDDKGSGSSGTSSSGSTASGKPTPGGAVTYGLEAENSGGWCLPEGQLAISGIQVARAIYDTLTMPDKDAKAVPYLAKSVTPNENFTEWTITLRDGVKFHDGTALDATVVKNNIDAWRGTYAGRNPLLFRFVYDNIADTTVVDPMTVKVTTKTPWPSFDSYLFLSGRAGIMAQAQLDDKTTCDTNLIGTGPFKLKEWKVNDHLTATKNPDYWQKDANGVQLPYLNEITFRPIPDGDARVNALLSGELNAMHTSGAEQIDALRNEKDNGKVNLTESTDFAEVAYIMFNASKPPFNNQNARLAAAYSLDREAFNKVRNLGMFKMASGPFAPGEVGYLDDAGFPKYDLKKAKEYVQKYKDETGQDLEFTAVSTSDPSTVKSAQFIQEQAQKAGMKVTLRSVEQAALINTALGNDWQAISWRNHPGGNPDAQYVWWKGGSPVNFGKFNDPEMNTLLDQGRAEADKQKAAGIYQDINKLFGQKAYNLWLNWTQWDIATAPDVQGVYGPDLPNGGKPFTGLATGHPVVGMWVQQ
jgi:peptide/nickel transport system substrate-binding protein